MRRFAVRRMYDGSHVGRLFPTALRQGRSLGRRGRERVFGGGLGLRRRRRRRRARISLLRRGPAQVVRKTVVSRSHRDARAISHRSSARGCGVQRRTVVGRRARCREPRTRRIASIHGPTQTTMSRRTRVRLAR